MDAQLQEARRLYDIGYAAKTSYLQSKIDAHLRSAIKNFRAALKMVPKCRESLTLQKCLTGLAQAYYYRFEADKKQSDIDEAVHYAKEALSILKPETDRLRYLVLANVATYLAARYRWTNEQHDLESSLDHARQALRVALEGHVNRLECLQKVATALIDRYLHFSHLKDLKEAMRLEEELLGAAEHSDAIKSGYRSDYGTCFWLLFQGTLYKTHLKSAIDQTQLALTHASDNNADRYVYMKNLAVYCAEAFERGRVSTDLSIALEHAKNACGVKLPADMQTSVWASLASIYALKFEESGNVCDIDEAILWVGKVIAALPENHPKQTRYRSNLGVYYLHKFDKFASQEDLELGVGSLREACFKARSPPLDRLVACSEALRCHVSDGDYNDWPSAAQIADVALEILPNVISPTNTRLDLQHTVRHVDGVSGYIPSILLKAGRSTAGALTALENSRNLIFNLTLDTNLDCLELQKRDQNLWQQYRHCQEEVRRN
jgi:tetratricopeptide (TPR) repeat protein